jgi:hypothetical protein
MINDLKTQSNRKLQLTNVFPKVINLLFNFLIKL